MGIPIRGRSTLKRERLLAQAYLSLHFFLKTNPFCVTEYMEVFAGSENTFIYSLWAKQVCLQLLMSHD